MSPLRLINNTAHANAPRDILIQISRSLDELRVGKHVIKPGENFVLEQNESAEIFDWIKDKAVPVELGNEDVWVFHKYHELSVDSLRAFDRPKLEQIKRRGKTLMGLTFEYLPITKEKF